MQIDQVRDQKGAITADLNGFQNVIRNYYEINNLKNRII